MTRAGTVRVGLSGWTYAPWRGRIYPKGLPHRAELAYAAARFGSIEINGTFYGLQRLESYARWVQETPEGFVSAVKGSRYITHFLKLKEIEAALANFFASGVLRLGPKLGPILWQFPPRMAFDAERFDAFLAALPRTTSAALALARRHDARVAGRAWLEIDEDRPIRHAVEIRHESFRGPAFIELRRRRTALVCADAVEWPLLMDLTADFVQCRLHGSEELYVSGYGDATLEPLGGAGPGLGHGPRARRRLPGEAANSAARRRPGRVRLLRQRRQGPRARRRRRLGQAPGRGAG